MGSPRPSASILTGQDAQSDPILKNDPDRKRSSPLHVKSPLKFLKIAQLERGKGKLVFS
jgi:hypothetical protein